MLIQMFISGLMMQLQYLLATFISAIGAATVIYFLTKGDW